MVAVMQAIGLYGTVMLRLYRCYFFGQLVELQALGAGNGFAFTVIGPWGYEK